MAIHTGDIFRAMHRGFEYPWIDCDGNRLSPDLGAHTFLLVTGQAGFVSGLFRLNLRRCLRGCDREEHDH
jgi:hypothetical protein